MGTYNKRRNYKTEWQHGLPRPQESTMFTIDTCNLLILEPFKVRDKKCILEYIYYNIYLLRNKYDCNCINYIFECTVFNIQE